MIRFTLAKRIETKQYGVVGIVVIYNVNSSNAEISDIIETLSRIFIASPQLSREIVEQFNT